MWKELWYRPDRARYEADFEVSTRAYRELDDIQDQTVRVAKSERIHLVFFWVFQNWKKKHTE